MKYLLASFFLISFSASASPMIGAKSAGMGSTGRAAVESIESLYLNPAALALMGDFHLGTSYQSGSLPGKNQRDTYSFTVTDASPGVLFPASFGYRRHRLSGNGSSIKEQEFRLATGKRLSKRLSLGVAASHIQSEMQSGESFKQTDLHAGVLIGLKPNWGLSLTADGLLDKSDPDQPQELERLARWAVGTQYIFRGALRFRWEVLSPLRDSGRPKGLAHHFGLGTQLQSDFNLNLGYSVDDYQGENWWSAGLAWEGPRLKLAYSFQQELRQEIGSRHLIDLWLDL